MINYPANRQQQKFFAQRYIRKLVKACVANELGADAVWLLTVIVTTEDAKRYRGAVTFHNGQMLPLLGFAKWERLDTARRKAVEAGLLHYEASGPGSRQPGRYWVLEPEGFDEIGDAPVDDSRYANDTPQRDTVGGTDQSEAYPANGYAQGDAQGYAQGELSILYPVPVPNTDAHAVACSGSKAAPKPSKPKPKVAPKAPPDIPAVLDTPEFVTAWGDWQQHRRQRDRKPLTDTALSRQLTTLAAMGSPQAAIAAIGQSIERNWSGLFPVDAPANRPTRQPSPARVHTGRYDNAPDRY